LERHPDLKGKSLEASKRIMRREARLSLKPRRTWRMPLILKRASASRPSGEWRDDDYDVLASGEVVGRIMLSRAAPQDRPWIWASGHNGDIRRAAHGYEATREAAMVAFARSWRRE
jgi:hypothetical protein